MECRRDPVASHPWATLVQPDDAQRALMDQILERAGKFRAALKAQFTGSFTTVH
jgi:hypothetical protein